MMRFATIGTSWITKSYIDGALASGLWELTAVYSRSEDTGRNFAEAYHVEHVFTNLEEMAKSDLFDAVYIASPNKLHTAQTKLFLQNGKHVICEKPLASHGAEVRELQALAKDKNLVYLEAIMFMHLPQRKILEEALQKIGDLSFVKLDFCQRSSKLDSYLAGNLPNIFNPALETGALMDLGVYCFYPALYLFGAPEKTQITAHMLRSGADGAGIVSMQYPDKLVNITYSKIGQAGANTDFQGNLGTVSVESISKLENMTLRYNDGTTEKLFGAEPKETLMGYEAIDFYRFITESAEYADAYEKCCTVAVQVSDYMEALRNAAGIRFPSDPQ